MKYSFVSRFLTDWSRTILRLLLVSLFTNPSFAQTKDWRNIRTGLTIPDETYSDQPYIVKTDEGPWLCVMTTGSGNEGTSGQHIVTQRSWDQGQSWVDKVDVEPADGPEASYAVLLRVPSGRIYVFYNHNTDNTRAIKADDPPYQNGLCKRVDSQGHFVFKFSDDHGRTWSKERYDIPQRNFVIDRNNPYAGEIKYFWNVGRAFIHQNSGYVPIIKVGGFGPGFFTSNEGALLQSDNILTERDPKKIRWQTLPDGEIGLRTPPGGGPISAEQNFSILSDGSIYCVYRTIDGHPVNTYSRDNGHTWEVPRYKAYANGRLMKHPRAANFAWKCSNGKYLYWFHNHGGKSYDDRNPAWICGGIEADSPSGKIIQWTQPEILLYDDDPYIRMSYPDLIEDKGKYYLTETQKDIARLHQIDAQLLERLWLQFENDAVTKDGLVVEWKKGDPLLLGAPNLSSLVARNHGKADHGNKDLAGSFSIELKFTTEEVKPGLILCDTREKNGSGWFIRTTEMKTIEFLMNDGRTKASWACDTDLIDNHQSHHMVIVVDGGPRLILFVVDGVLNDGGDHRQFGWGRFSPNFRSANGGEMMTIVSDKSFKLELLRIYDRYLTISESIGNYKNTLLDH